MHLLKSKPVVLMMVTSIAVTGSVVRAVCAAADMPTAAVSGQKNNAGADQRPASDTMAQFLKRAELFRPTKAELAWQQIPWVAVDKDGVWDEAASIKMALEQARKEKRPVLIWSVDGNPLDQC